MPDNTSLLRVEGLSKAFGGLAALSEVSFGVQSGTVTSIIGPNGAGKTTLFNVISGILRPSKGRVIFRGHDITGKQPHKICGHGIGRTFQNVQLFHTLNVIENVMAARYSRSSRAQMAGIGSARAEGLALGLLASVGLERRQSEMPTSLSYGEQRRLEIARAMATQPELLLLDEPFAGMTTPEAGDLGALLNRFVAERQVSILLIEHNMAMVMSLSSHVVVLNFGQKVAEGSPASVQSNPRVIDAYLGAEGE